MRIHTIQPVLTTRRQSMTRMLSVAALSLAADPLLAVDVAGSGATGNAEGSGETGNSDTSGATDGASPERDYGASDDSNGTGSSSTTGSSGTTGSSSATGSSGTGGMGAAPAGARGAGPAGGNRGAGGPRQQNPRSRCRANAVVAQRGAGCPAGT